MSPLFKPPIGEHVAIARRDSTDLLGTCSDHSIDLDDQVWPTVEHYFQAMQFDKPELQAWIRASESAKVAIRRGEPGFLKQLFRPRRPDWDEVKSVYMTRALYTKCKMYDFIASRLLETGDKLLLDPSQYDYYWGLGRDQRGLNMYGQVLMNVRQKLSAE